METGREKKWSLRIKPGGIKQTQTYISFSIDMLTWHDMTVDMWHMTLGNDNPPTPLHFSIYMVLVLLWAHIEIFIISLMQPFYFEETCGNKTIVAPNIYKSFSVNLYTKIHCCLKPILQRNFAFIKRMYILSFSV